MSYSAILNVVPCGGLTIRWEQQLPQLSSSVSSFVVCEGDLTCDSTVMMRANDITSSHIYISLIDKSHSININSSRLNKWCNLLGFNLSRMKSQLHTYASYESMATMTSFAINFATIRVQSLIVTQSLKYLSNWSFPIDIIIHSTRSIHS